MTFINNSLFIISLENHAAIANSSAVKPSVQMQVQSTRALVGFLQGKLQNENEFAKYLGLLCHAAMNQTPLESLNGKVVTLEQVENAVDQVRDQCKFPIRPTLLQLEDTKESDFLKKCREVAAASGNTDEEVGKTPNLQWRQQFKHVEHKTYTIIQAGKRFKLSWG